MKNVAVAVVLASVGLGFCTGSWAQAKNCDGKGACKVDISVNDCKITPTPDPLSVSGKNILIFWELDAASASMYQFPDDGIKLKTASPEFSQPQAQANRKKFKLHDKNSLSGKRSYPYAIKVQKKAGQAWTDCPVLDPTIVNEG